MAEPEDEGQAGVLTGAQAAVAAGIADLRSPAPPGVPGIAAPSVPVRGGGGLPPNPPAPRRGGSSGGWPPAPPGVPATRSTYIDYLPGIYKESDFIGRFLLIFEHILSPVHRTVGNIPYIFDPAHVPASLIEWLGSWVGLVLDPRWPERRRRDLIAAAVPLYRFRGTRRGLSEFIRLYTGYAPEITEPTVRDVSADRSLAFRFDVVLRVDDPATVDRELVESIIELEKPAFSAFTLQIVANAR